MTEAPRVQRGQVPSNGGQEYAQWHMAFSPNVDNAFLLPLRLSGAASIVGCNLCGDDPIVRSASPDGRHELIVACVDCGATTIWAHQVRIVRRHSWFARQALVLAAEAPAGCSAEEIRATWLDDSRVRVDFEGQIGRTYPVRRSVDGVDVDVRRQAQDP